MENMNLKLLFKFIISCLFATYLSLSVDWSIIFHAFSEINPFLYIVSTLLACGSIICVAFKYHVLIKDTAISHTVVSLTKINLISRFYAIFLPSAIGPESVRWYKVTRNQEGRAFFLAVTIFERLIFLFVLIFSGFLPLFFYSSYPEILILRARLFPIVIVSISFIIIAKLYLLFPSIRIFFNTIIERIVPNRWHGHNTTNFFQNFSLKRPNLYLFIIIFGLSLFWQVFFLCRLFLLFKSAALPLNFIDVAWMGSLVLLLQVLPVSFAGIGVREGAYAYLFTLFNLPPEKGVLIGILFFSQMIILASIGGLFELIEK
jgi:uncharacterized protein (TIRG00374 family)